MDAKLMEKLGIKTGCLTEHLKTEEDCHQFLLAHAAVVAEECAKVAEQSDYEQAGKFIATEIRDRFAPQGNI